MHKTAFLLGFVTCTFAAAAACSDPAPSAPPRDGGTGADAAPDALGPSDGGDGGGGDARADGSVPGICAAVDTDAGVSDAAAPRDAGGLTCFDGARPTALATRGEPKLRPGACADAQRNGFFDACLGVGSNQAVCDAFLKNAANKPCVECLLGPQPGTTNIPAMAPPALLSDGDSVLLNIGGCASAVTNNGCCGPIVGDETLCQQAACTTCDQGDKPACFAIAKAGPCAHAVKAATACNAALELQRDTWKDVCGATATTFEQAYGPLTKSLCGTP
jgi:hypothetical protein